jgi:hypothetical protein
MDTENTNVTYLLGGAFSRSGILPSHSRRASKGLRQNWLLKNSADLATKKVFLRSSKGATLTLNKPLSFKERVVTFLW